MWKINWHLAAVLAAVVALLGVVEFAEAESQQLAVDLWWSEAGASTTTESIDTEDDDLVFAEEPRQSGHVAVQVDAPPATEQIPAGIYVRPCIQLFSPVDDIPVVYRLDTRRFSLDSSCKSAGNALS